MPQLPTTVVVIPYKAGADYLSGGVNNGIGGGTGFPDRDNPVAFYDHVGCVSRGISAVNDPSVFDPDSFHRNAFFL